MEFSPEQEAIISLALPPPEPDARRNGNIIRVTAAAGSGKTTTLQGFGDRLIRLEHTDILYVTYSRTAAADAQRRLDRRIECRTIHSATLREVRDFYPEDMSIKDELEIDEYILKNYRKSIDAFLSSVTPTEKQKQSKDPKLSYRKTVASYIRKTMTRFLRSWDSLYRGFDPSNKYNTYYLAQQWHDGRKIPGLTTDKEVYREFYVGHAKKLFDALRDGTEGYVTFDMITKEAQLRHVEIPCDALLVDESQDCTQCQISLLTNQKRFGTQVVLVGDAAQTIYGFRGAKSRHLMQVKDCTDRTLTKSHRFGSEIAAIANTILFYKQYSPQTTEIPNSWIPYRVKVKPGVQGSIMDHEKNFSDGEQYAVIGKANLSLFSFCLENLIGKELEVKVAINGNGENSGRRKWLSMFNKIDALYSLKRGKNKHDIEIEIKSWKEFSGENITSWHKFKEVVHDRELTEYKMHISLIEEYGDETPEKVKRFKESVLDKHYSQEESDVILTTTHAAKGMEWDNVRVLDDFIELSKYKYDEYGRALFDTEKWKDEINLWYVAVTRARKKLILPPKFVDLITSLDVILKHGSNINKKEPSTQRAILEKIRFYGRPPEIEEFKRLYQTLAIDWKYQMDFDVRGVLSTYVESNGNDERKKTKISTDVSTPKRESKRIKRPRLVSP